MTKRDTITRIRYHYVDDGTGGQKIDSIEELEVVPAHISADYSANEITMYGIKTQVLLHAVTDVKLDEYYATRYEWSGRLFKLMRQIKSGNEWFATLLEVVEEGLNA